MRTWNFVSSKPSLLQYGVPQGLVLGPVLFALYTQPVSHIMCRHMCGFQNFADDTQLGNSALHVTSDCSLAGLNTVLRKVIFLCCARSLEHSPLRNQVIQHHLILQIIN